MLVITNLISTFLANRFPSKIMAQTWCFAIFLFHCTCHVDWLHTVTLSTVTSTALPYYPHMLVHTSACLDSFSIRSYICNVLWMAMNSICHIIQTEIYFGASNLVFVVSNHSIQAWLHNLSKQYQVQPGNHPYHHLSLQISSNHCLLHHHCTCSRLQHTLHE